MVKFLDSDGIKSELSKILKKSNDFIYLVSPYLSIIERYRAIVEDAANQGIEIHVIYGKNEMKTRESEWFETVDRVWIHYWKNLHSKCYMNEKAAIITSLNLYEYSMINNHEMGIVIYRNQDSDVYEDILDEVKRLIRISDTVRVPKTIDKSENPHMEKPLFPRKGYCIRCGETIEYDPDKPYCDKHMKSWNRYKNPDYIEKEGHCHICGKTWKTSMNSPVCQKCITDKRLKI